MAMEAVIPATRSVPAPESVHFLNYPPSTSAALACLPDELAHWFARNYESPTLAQRFAWPTLARGDNLLLAAPTGSGKTLAAFLPMIGALLADPTPTLQCLYIAPLKALIRDVAKNLRRALRAVPSAKHLRVGIRTGDTSWKVRRRMLETPPHVLLTTPESLAVLLSQPAACAQLASVGWVVIDEVHALAGSKRGADLALGLERLEAWVRTPLLTVQKPGQKRSSNPHGLQRIGLSATCTPLDEAARFLVGVGRPCAVAQIADTAGIDLAIEPLPLTDETGLPASFLKRLGNRLHDELTRHRTTLIFANTRALAERVAWALAKRYPDRQDQIAVHHSSLAPARRRAVERRLKQGKLWAAVSSTSLELGIDIGSIDSVVFVHPPGGAARLVQRLGRSGHRPGQPRRGLVLTSSTSELLEATVTAAAGREGQIERLRIPPQPLDVLCQHLAGMAMTESWSPAEALNLVRRAHPYRELSDADFYRCLDYLSGRHADGSAWLPSRLAWTDDGRFTIASEALAKLLRRNLGTIVSDEPRAIRLLTEENGEEKKTALGTLDELYADRLQPGDRFLLGGRPLEYRRRDRAALLVREAGGQPAPPRWVSGGIALPAELVRRLFLFRAEAGEVLRDGPDALAAWLRTHYNLEAPAIDELTRYLSLQESVSEIPDDRVLLVESIRHDAGIEYVLHTPLPRAANEAIARLLTLRMACDHHVESLAADLGVLLYVRGHAPIDVAAWRRLLSPDACQTDIETALHGGWLVRERFAAVATTGLMVLRHPIGGRRKVGGPDWAQRRLFDQIRSADPDFLLLRQAERETAAEVCDAAQAAVYLGELAHKMIRCRWLSEPSPFAAGWLHDSTGHGQGSFSQHIQEAV